MGEAVRIPTKGVVRLRITKAAKEGFHSERGAGLAILFFVLLAANLGFAMDSTSQIPRTGKETLKEMLGNPDLVILDVRTAHSWESSNLKIQGAIRRDPDAVYAWAHNYRKDQTIVLYCA